MKKLILMLSLLLSHIAFADNTHHDSENALAQKESSRSIIHLTKYLQDTEGKKFIEYSQTIVCDNQQPMCEAKLTHHTAYLHHEAFLHRRPRPDFDPIWDKLRFQLDLGNDTVSVQYFSHYELLDIHGIITKTDKSTDIEKFQLNHGATDIIYPIPLHRFGWKDNDKLKEYVHFSIYQYDSDKT